MKIARLILALLVSSLILGACSEYNKTKVRDKNANSDKVYGDKNGPARQLANKYESNPKTAEQVKTIKEILYPSK